MLRCARERCARKDHDMYKWYGGRGIHCTLTVEQMRILWIRDKGAEQKKPSLERKDPNGNYEFDNCEIIEMVENLRRANEANRIKRLAAADGEQIPLELLTRKDYAIRREQR
jgi:hypothetical protein